MESTECRKAKGLSQKELADLFNTSHTTIGRYERDEMKPSVEVASKMAQYLDVSLDFLVGNTDIELDRALLDKVVSIQKLPDEDKNCIMYSIDGLIQHAKTRLAYK